MKKLTLLLAILLACLCILPAGAENRKLLVPETDYSYIDIQSACVADGSVYLLANDNGITCLYRWAPGMEKEEVMIADLDLSANRLGAPEAVVNTFTVSGDEAEPETAPAAGNRTFSILFSDGERVMSLDLVTGTVFSIRLENYEQVFEDVVTLSDVNLFLHTDSDYVYFPGTSGLACVDGKLVAFVQDWNAEGYEDNRIVVADLTTGEVRQSSVPFVRGLCEGPDGKAVIVTRDDNNAWHEDGTVDALAVSLYDPKDDSVTPVGELAVDYLNGTIGYSTRFNAVMYLNNNRIMGFSPANGESRQYGFVTANGYSRCNLLAMDDLLIIPGWSGVLVREISDAFSSDRYLNVYGSWNDEGRILFSANNPNIPVYDSEAYYATIEALNQAMVSGEDTLDVLCMDVTYSSFLTMRDKGYCADLSGYPDLVEAVGRMYPQFRAAVTAKDGTLRAIPLSAYSYGWYVNTSAMEALGLTMEELPTNYVDLCAFINDFNDNRADDQDDFTLFDYVYDLKEYLFTRVLEDYMGWCTATGRELSFNTPEFRAVMTAVEGLRTDRLKVSDYEHDVYYTGLFDIGSSVVGNFNDNSYSVLLPMTLTADTGFVTGVNLRVMFINPRSANTELAAELLSCELQAMSQNNRHVLYTDATEPVENPYYEENLRAEEQYVAQMRELLETADEAEKPEIQSMIDAELAFVAQYADSWRYEISPEAIQHYLNDLVPCMYVAEPTFLSGDMGEASSEMVTLINRYTQGQISLDQFIREADNKLFMIRMENN